MIHFFLASFLAGIITKYSDFLADDAKKKKLYLGIAFSILYGILVGFLMSSDARFFVLILGIILGNILSKKIDHINHQIAFVPILGIIILTWFMNGIPAGLFSLLPLTLVFFIAAVCDEQLNPSEAKRKMLKKKLGKIYLIAEYRLVLEATTLVVSIILWDPYFALLLICFDLGYIVSAKVAAKNLK